MFGNSKNTEKIKELEETIKKLKTDLANQKVEFNSIVKKNVDFTTSITLLQKEIDELKELKNASIFNTLDVPNIPWVHEVITNPEGPCFTVFSTIQKLKIWENIFNNIGFTSKYDIIERYPFHFVEEEMEEFSMKNLGLLYFSELGTGYGSEETCTSLINLRDLKMISDEYPQMIEKIVHVVKPGTFIQNYKEVFDKDSWNFTLTFDIVNQPVELVFEGTKYLDTACIDQLITHLQDDLSDSKKFYFFWSDFAYNLCYINEYQKMMLEKIFKLENRIKPLPNA